MEQEQVWHGPSDEEIEQAVNLIVEGRWQTVFEIDAVDIAWVASDWETDLRAHQEFLDFWKTTSGADPGNKLRDRDVDPLLFPRLLKNIMYLECVDEGFDAIYRVYGTEIASQAGIDWTGKRVSELNRSARTEFSLFYRSCYRAIYKTGRPLYTSHRSPLWISAKSWRRLILLVFNETSENVQRFLVCNIPVDGKALTNTERDQVREKYYSNLEHYHNA